MENLLSVKNLNIYVNNDLKAVDSLSFDLKKGEILGIVGESGCGKTLTALALARLLNKNIRAEGEIFLDGKNISSYSDSEFLKLRKSEISMIFQDSAFNPLMKIGHQVIEAIRDFENNTKAKNFEITLDLLKKVRLNDPETSFYKYPHELSGGQRQRVMIAMSIASNPKLLIADEVTTALDVTTQLQILNLLKELQNDTGMIIISHDVSVIKHICDFVCIMYSGNILEYGPAREVLENPKHPYTYSLLKSIPSQDKDQILHSIRGIVPSLKEREKIHGCIFAPRCDFVCTKHKEEIQKHYISPEHYVLCHRNGEFL